MLEIVGYISDSCGGSLINMVATHIAPNPEFEIYDMPLLADVSAIGGHRHCQRAEILLPLSM
jgi:hypothetical protein